VTQDRKEELVDAGSTRVVVVVTSCETAGVCTGVFVVVGSSDDRRKEANTDTQEERTREGRKSVMRLDEVVGGFAVEGEGHDDLVSLSVVGEDAEVAGGFEVR